MEQELLALRRLMASQPDHELLGRGEFALRDKLNQVGANVVEESVNARARIGVLR